MLGKTSRLALSGLCLSFLTAAPAAAQTARDRVDQVPAPCRAAMSVDRLSCSGPIGRSGAAVPSAMRAILFGPAWNPPTLSEASGRTRAGGPQSEGATTAARRPPFVLPVVQH